MSGFVVPNLKSDDRDRSGLKNELYPVLNTRHGIQGLTLPLSPLNEAVEQTRTAQTLARESMGSCSGCWSQRVASSV